MNNRISSKIAWGIILALSAIILITAWILTSNPFQNGKFVNNMDSAVPQTDETCEVRAFTGEVKIHAWPAYPEQESILKISEEEIERLPLFDGSPSYKQKNSEITLIDLTPELKNKLKKATEKNPVEITLRGYAFPCDGNSLASTEYQPGIFKNYLGLGS